MVAEVRVPCCVPFCRRWTHGKAGSDYICWGHWKTIPLARRRAYVRAAAERCPKPWGEVRKRPRWMRYRPERTADSCENTRPRSIRAIWRLWNRLKRTAIEKAL